MAHFLNKLMGIKDEAASEGSVEYSEAAEESAVTKIGNAEAGKEGKDKDWLDENYEGQLSVDVYGTDGEVVIVSTIAGVKPEDIDIAINNDMLTIRGQRTQEKEESVTDYYYQECYWGGFSRSIILPVEVDADNVSASLKNGVLVVRLPRSRKAKSISVRVKEE